MVYTIDLLGCGRSEKLNMTYTNYLYVQLISDFIKSEIGHRVNVIATGEAASIPVMACANNPELFDPVSYTHLGATINTFAPQALEIGGFTTEMCIRDSSSMVAHLSSVDLPEPDGPKMCIRDRRRAGSSHSRYLRYWCRPY